MPNLDEIIDNIHEQQKQDKLAELNNRNIYLEEFSKLYPKPAVCKQPTADRLPLPANEFLCKLKVCDAELYQNFKELFNKIPSEYHALFWQYFDYSYVNEDIDIAMNGFSTLYTETLENRYFPLFLYQSIRWENITQDLRHFWEQIRDENWPQAQVIFNRLKKTSNVNLHQKVKGLSNE